MKQSDNDALHVCNGSATGRAPQLDAVICSGNLAVPGQQRVSVCVCVCVYVCVHLHWHSAARHAGLMRKHYCFKKK